MGAYWQWANNNINKYEGEYDLTKESPTAPRYVDQERCPQPLGASGTAEFFVDVSFTVISVLTNDVFDFVSCVKSVDSQLSVVEGGGCNQVTNIGNDIFLAYLYTRM